MVEAMREPVILGYSAQGNTQNDMDTEKRCSLFLTIYTSWPSLHWPAIYPIETGYSITDQSGSIFIHSVNAPITKWYVVEDLNGRMLSNRALIGALRISSFS
jgi:hypothetical protein